MPIMLSMGNQPNLSKSSTELSLMVASNINLADRFCTGNNL